MYQISRIQFYSLLRKYQSTVARSLSDFHNSAAFPLNGMDEHIGRLYECDGFRLGVKPVQTCYREDGFMTGLIDDETVLVIPFSEWYQKYANQPDPHYSIIEEIDDDEGGFAMVQDADPYKLYSAFTWLGDMKF